MKISHHRNSLLSNSLKRDVAETLQNASDQTKTAQLDAVIAASGQDVKNISGCKGRCDGSDI